jgi:transcriptional regulator with XRE-family HTH domain
MDNLLHEKIRAVRRELNLTQENIARELNISYQNYQKYEHGERKISAELLSKIADAMKVTTEYIKEKELAHISIVNNNCTGNIGYNNINNDVHELIQLVREMNENNLKYLEKIILKVLEGKD